LLYMTRDRDRGPKQSNHGQNRDAKEDTHVDILRIAKLAVRNGTQTYRYPLWDRLSTSLVPSNAFWPMFTPECEILFAVQQ
jgi:hypothetical protein